jgi:hypothetical protein
MDAAWYPRNRFSYMRVRAALEVLKAGSWVELALNYGADIGRARVWRRTAKFDGAFRMKVGDRLIVREALLSQPVPLVGQGLEEVPGLETYAELINTVELSRSDRGQVYKIPNLRRHDEKRIYAHGTYNYQGLHKEERRCLLINDQPVGELDYSGMHPNLLLNRAGLPCQPDVYGPIVAALGIDNTTEHRKAIKLIINAAFSVQRPCGFARMVRNQVDDNGTPLVDLIGSPPADMAKAIIGTYPALRPFFCTGKWWEWLQKEESEIMIDTLETLAKKGVIGLPLHDSVIAPKRYENVVRLVMREAYQRRKGFDIRVK